MARGIGDECSGVYNEGYKAYLRGITANPYPLKSRFHDDWRTGWLKACIEEGLAKAVTNNEGYAACRRGEPLAANPYSPASREWVEWRQGWREACRLLP